MAGSSCGTSGCAADEENVLAHFAFVSLKPLLVVLNVAETDSREGTPWPTSAGCCRGATQWRWQSAGRSRWRSKSAGAGAQRVPAAS